MNEWNPAEDDLRWSGAATPDPIAPRVKRRPNVGWSVLFFLLAAVFGGSGLIFTGLFGIGLGAIFLIACVAVDRVHWICDGCGNRVEATSVMCPACRSRLVHPDQFARMKTAQAKAGVRKPAQKRPAKSGPKRGGR